MDNLIEEIKSLQDLQKIISSIEDLDPEDGKPLDFHFYGFYCSYYLTKVENLRKLSELCYSEPALQFPDDL